MSKLDELIRELCPKGVENKKLGDIATISRGGNFQKKNHELLFETQYSIYYFYNFHKRCPKLVFVFVLLKGYAPVINKRKERSVHCINPK